MTILRWILGIILAGFASGWIFTIVIFVVNGDDRLKDLGKRLGLWTKTMALFWFNCEIWGRVIYTIWTWGGPSSS